MSIRTLVGALAAALLLPGGLAAQAESQPQMFFVYQDHVKPSMIVEYEAAGAEFVAMLADAGEAAPATGYTAVSGQRIGYAYVVPLDGLAGFDQMNAAFGAVAASMGERWTEITARSNAAVDRSEGAFYVHRPDLSYQPLSPRLTDEEVKMIHYDFWYALPGHAEGLEGVAKEFVELYRSNEMDTGWNVYQAVTGADMPLYVVTVGAVDEADYYANEAALNERIGEQGQVLYQKALGFARRVEPTIGWLRPELSYEPEMTLAAPDGK